MIPGESVLFVDHSKTDRTGHLGHALVEYADGKILAFYPNSGGGHHSSRGWTEFKRSVDGGKTWSDPIVLEYSRKLFEQGKQSSFCEKAVRNANGDIILFHLISNIENNPRWSPQYVPTYSISKDGGETWSDAKPLGKKAGRIYDAIAHDGKIYVLRFANDCSKGWRGSSEEHVYELFVSEDGGATFTNQGALPVGWNKRGYGTLGILAGWRTDRPGSGLQQGSQLGPAGICHQ